MMIGALPQLQQGLIHACLHVQKLPCNDGFALAHA